jgi:hypothetical protein
VVGVEVAEVEEAEVVAVVADGDELLEVLVSKVFQDQWDVVRVEEELGQIFELEDVGDFEPLQEEEQGSRDGFVTDFSESGLVELFHAHVRGLRWSWEVWGVGGLWHV